MKKFSLYLLLLCSLAVGTQAQDYSTQNKKAIKLYERALETLYQGKRDAAMNSLEQALREDDGFLEAHLVLADLMQDLDKEAGSVERAQSGSYWQQAKRHYRAVVERQRDFYAAAWLNLGRMELADAHYDEAIACYGTHLELEKRDAEAIDESRRGVAAARFRKEAVAHPVPFNPTNMGAAINSRNDEYLPALTADGETLVFTRRQPRRATTTARTPEEEDFYVSHLSEGRWTTAQRMPEPVNTTDNEGAQCISQDGRIMFFTACDRQGGAGRCDLYMCIRRGDQWGKPRNLGPQVNSGAWESQPSFSIDGKTLYFVSDRKGGLGGMDIWKTMFENGQWSTPENLGPEVNTSGNEMTPFVGYDDRTLYFSSDGHPGMGGMDLFVARRQADGSWGQVRNLGYPINDSGDESGLIVSADGRTAIYASSRTGGMGRQDLWQFELPAAVQPTVAFCLKGHVSNAKSGQPVAADIRIVDLANGSVVANTSSDKQQGDYIISLPAGCNYALHVSADGYLFHSQNVERDERDMADKAWRPTVVDIALSPIESGERIALRNVFFETAKYELLPSSQYELTKVVELLQKNPTLRIELGGHTDNVGRPEANQRLSEQRARAVYDYLVGHGINAARLSYRGYGETQPISSNETEEGRAANRRTEMKVL